MRQRAEMRKWRQQQTPGADLNQRNQMRRRAGQALDDQRGNRIEKRRTQGQRNAHQIVIAAFTLGAMGTDNRQHAHERNRQPEQLLQGDFLAKKQRRQTDQHERLHVVHRRADGNRSP